MDDNKRVSWNIKSLIEKHTVEKMVHYIISFVKLLFKTPKWILHCRPIYGPA